MRSSFATRSQDRAIRHGLYHVGGNDPQSPKSKEDVRSRHRLGEFAELRRPCIAREVGIHLLGAAFINDAHAVRDENVLAPHPQAHQEIEAGERRSPSPAAGKPYLADVFPDDLQPVQDGRRHDNRGAMLIVVHDGDFHSLPKLMLDLEALRGLDILEVDCAEGRLEGGDGVDKPIRVGGGHLDVENVDPREFLEKNRLAFHHRLRGERPDVAEAQDRGPVRDDADKVCARGQPRRRRIVGYDCLASEGDAGRISERQVALRGKRLGRRYCELTRGDRPRDTRWRFP